MKKVLFTIFFIAIGANAQGNLQFNQVINLSGPNINYTVPTGKVLKIESIGVGKLCVPITGSFNTLCGSQAFSINLPVYGPFPYLNISGAIFYTGSTNGSCNELFNPPQPSYKELYTAAPSLQFPIWLKEGKTITIPNITCAEILISGIEFNITQ